MRSRTFYSVGEVQRAQAKADAALLIATAALMVATQKPRRRSLGDRLWDML